MFHIVQRPAMRNITILTRIDRFRDSHILCKIADRGVQNTLSPEMNERAANLSLLLEGGEAGSHYGVLTGVCTNGSSQQAGSNYRTIDVGETRTLSNLPECTTA